MRICPNQILSAAVAGSFLNSMLIIIIIINLCLPPIKYPSPYPSGIEYAN